MEVVSPIREKLITGNKSYHDVTVDICRHVEDEPTKEWKIAFGVSLLVLAYGSFWLGKTWWEGLGVWGLNKTVNWAWDITNFVWWVG
ncbi:MAG: hydrogenase, partial [Spirosomataceae bacterium]